MCLESVHDHMIKGNSAVATLNGMVTSGSGNSGVSVLKLATEGKVASPKCPVDANVTDTESDIEDFDETT